MDDTNEQFVVLRAFPKDSKWLQMRFDNDERRPAMGVIIHRAIEHIKKLEGKDDE